MQLGREAQLHHFSNRVDGGVFLQDGRLDPRCQDLRITKTKAALQDALLASIARDGWDDVTIQGVCQLANVGRSTFYLHYATKEALLTDGLNGLRDALLLIQKSDSSAGKFLFLPELLRHMVEQKNVFKAVCGRRSGQGVERHFREMVTQLVQHEMESLHPIPARQAWLASSTSGLIVEAMIWWVESPNPPHVDELACELGTVLTAMLNTPG